MFEWLYKRGMSEFGRELVASLSRKDKWSVKDNWRDWTHDPSGIQLWVGKSHVYVLDIPNVRVASEDKDKLLNFCDRRMLKLTTKKARKQYNMHEQQSATATAVNLLRLSQHKENGNV
jgi:hypothetical protein